MFKYIILVTASLCLAACAAHDGRYYSLHPNNLQKALAECPGKHPSHVSCEELKNIAARVNELSYQLRLNPQGFGKEILTLQELIAKQESSVSEASNQAAGQPSVSDNKRALEERLAIVKWLESPS